MRKNIFWVIGGLLLGIALIGISVVLYFTARIQQGLLTQPPQYTASQYYARAVAQIDQGDYQQAENYLEQALLKEDDATYRNQLAVVKYRLKKYDEAIREYQKLIAAGIDVSFAWNGIGNSYRDWANEHKDKQDEYQQKAIEAYQKSLSSNEKYIAAYSNWAILLDSLNKHQDAIVVLDQGIAKTGSEELINIKSTLLK